jgi:predicted nucleic acid-binding protein
VTNSTSGEFCDTNVFIYAFDRSAGRKHEIARRLVTRLTDDQNGVASVQVLQELFVNLTRKVVPRYPPEAARRVVLDLTVWHIVEPTANDVVLAIDHSVAWQVSFWDAMLLTAANRAGAAVLWSEVLNHGQTYGAVRVQDPFR